MMNGLHDSSWLVDPIARSIARSRCYSSTITGRGPGPERTRPPGAGARAHQASEWNADPEQELAVAITVERERDVEAQRADRTAPDERHTDRTVEVAADGSPRTILVVAKAGIEEAGERQAGALDQRDLELDAA